MRRYALIRTLSLLPTLVGVSIAVFLLIRLIPGTVVDQMVGMEGSYSEESKRLTRSSLLEVMRQDYVRTARAKGLSERDVVWIHALKNSLIPMITVAGVQVGYLLGGAVVTEEVFTLPGVGRLLLWAVFQRDYPVVQGTILFVSALFMLGNLVVDLVYAYVDPRIRYG